MPLELPASFRRFLLLALALSALSILWLGNYTDIDVRLADLFYDRTAHAFPWRDAWLTERFSHGIVKQLLIVLAAVPVCLVLGEMLLRRRFLGAWWRPRLRFVALCAAAIPTVTSLLKQASTSHCPWDLERYGGSQAYLRLLDHVPRLAEAGKCLPAGHASSALWLVAIGVFWLPHRPRAALAASAAGLASGLALGWLQQMRGAHFLTHTLWSAWIAVMLALVLLEATQPRRRALALQST